jgi:hypothetical protein
MLKRHPLSVMLDLKCKGELTHLILGDLVASEFDQLWVQRAQ